MKRNNADVASTYRDFAISGTVDPWQRAGFIALLEGLREITPDAIYVSDQSRFTRASRYYACIQFQQLELLPPVIFDDDCYTSKPFTCIWDSYRYTNVLRLY